MPPRPTDLPERPALRPLDVRRHDDPDNPGLVLVDRLGIAEPAFVPEDLLPIVGRCTGESTLAQIRAAASAQLGEDIPADAVAGIVRQLDEHLLLHGERFAAAADRAARQFLGAPARQAGHVGSAGCPAAPAELREELARVVRGPAGPATPLRGLVAPHIDLARGRSGYRAAYERLLAAPPADLYVVFGTGHAGPDAPVTGLPLDWETPLGTVPTDREFVASVHRVIGPASPGDLLHHRGEHSLEFQMLFLQHLHERRGGSRPFAVAGFLCGSLPSTSGDPLAEAWLQRLLGAFRAAEAASGRSVCYVAGADLAHVGPFFGDRTAVDAPRLASLERDERERLAILARGEPGRFHAAIECAGNPDHVCSAPAITLCAALAGGRGELLHYGQARAADGAQAVTFAALAFPG